MPIMTLARLTLLALLLPLVPRTAAAGLAVNIPLVGRVTGGGNVLFATSLDITNNAATPMPVTFYFTGFDAAKQQAFSVTGAVNDGGLAPANGGTMSAHTNCHVEDFVHALVETGQLPPFVEQDGITGSVLVVFESASKRGQGTVSARFYNAYGAGLVGVAIKGHEISTNEPQKIVATLRDTTGASGSQTYPNIFINNTGLAPNGSSAPAAVTVQLTAVSGRTGQPVGNAAAYTIPAGQTITVGHTFQALGIDITKEETIIVTVAVTSGNAAIAGVVSQVDPVTKDGSAFAMSRGDF